MLPDQFTNFSQKYVALKLQPFMYNEDTEQITRVIPEYITTKLNLSDTYTVRGSVGQGNWAETPWVAILDQKVTKSTQNGYYACFLINPSTRMMYLSLMVGWTQFGSEFATKVARERIQEYSNYLCSQLPHIPTGFRAGPIDLSATGQLSKGYEVGQILNKKYHLGDVNEKTLLDDLEGLIEVYEQLVQLVGDDIKNISYKQVVSNEKIDEVDKAINQVTLEETAAAALLRLKTYINDMPPEKRSVIAKKAVRNPKIARLIKESKSYVCELCERKPFIQKNGQYYAEADHIQSLGKEGYDSADNMRCLCAQCHAVITHGSKEEIERLFTK